MVSVGYFNVATRLIATPRINEKRRGEKSTRQLCLFAYFCFDEQFLFLVLSQHRIVRFYADQFYRCSCCHLTLKKWYLRVLFFFFLLLYTRKHDLLNILFSFPFSYCKGATLWMETFQMPNSNGIRYCYRVDKMFIKIWRHKHWSVTPSFPNQKPNITKWVPSLFTIWIGHFYPMIIIKNHFLLLEQDIFPERYQAAQLLYWTQTEWLPKECNWLRNWTYLPKNTKQAVTAQVSLWFTQFEPIHLP